LFLINEYIGPIYVNILSLGGVHSIRERQYKSQCELTCSKENRLYCADYNRHIQRHDIAEILLKVALNTVNQPTYLVPRKM
jgi:hypothetical protein